ncbi:MAG: hypothetical protein EPO07_04990 [Verrucomicrobia bacterium]|nr:MAG: hypothetical protein EPO07_04990 [Verrucomicrobiota bacterium]
MFTSTLGIRFVFWLGATVPRPAPVELLQALSRVEVTNDSGAGDGFQITFACARNALGDYSLVGDESLKPKTRVILGVIMGASPEALIDGVITHTQFNPGSAPGQATLTVTGKDLTAVMDFEEKNDSYQNQTDSVIVTRVLAGYASYGVVPNPSPTTDVPIMTERIPRQHETDLKFLQRLAQRNGYVFYLEPLTFGVSQGYWGPPVRTGLPQPALSVDLGSATNVKALNFSNDALATTATKGVFVVPLLNITVPIPTLPSLKIPPLAASPAPALRTTLQRETANQNAATAATTALASTMNAPDAATADGEVDSVRYGSVLRARRLVGVRGAGQTHDGFWYVKRVTHSITRNEYSQKFSLGREGVGTTTPVVRP